MANDRLFLFQILPNRIFPVWIVYKNNEIAARAVAIINPELSKKVDKNVGQLGYLEFINDTIALKLLLDTCSNWLAKRRCTCIWTDTRFSLNYQVGIQKSGFEHQHTFLMPRQPKYYSETLSSIGFEVFHILEFGFNFKE